MRFALAFGDGMICGPDLMRPLGISGTPTPDRRKRFRVTLAWDVQLFRDGEIVPIEGQTRDLSSEGLYCVVPTPIAVGEVVAYLLIVPTFGAGGQREAVHLSGQLQVLRLEHLPAALYGLACQVRDYKVLLAGTTA